MRKYFNYILGFALLMVNIVACNTADQDTSPVISPDNKPVATFTPLTTYGSVKEGDTVIYNVSIDKAIDRALTARARLVEGTADENDIVVIPGTIAPYTTSAQVMVIFPQDWDAEENETLKLEFGVFSIADRYLLNPSTINPTLDLTLSNYVSDTLGVLTSWQQEVTMFEVVERDVDMGGWTMTIEDTVETVTDVADEVDWDIFVSESAGFDILDPWSSNIVDAAATGDNPEELNSVGYPDGEYVIWANLYGNYLADYLAYTDSTLYLPIESAFSRKGTVLSNLVVAPAADQLPPVYQQGYDNDGSEVDIVLAKVVIANGKYTIIDNDATEYGPYKANMVRTHRPAKYNHAR